MSRIGTPGRRLGAIAPSARRRIGGDITGHVAAATQHRADPQPLPGEAPPRSGDRSADQRRNRTMRGAWPGGTVMSFTQRLWPCQGSWTSWPDNAAGPAHAACSAEYRLQGVWA